MNKQLTSYSLEDQGSIFIASLKKGTTFILNGKTYVVMIVGKKITRLKAGDETLTIRHEFNCNYGNVKVENMFRNIEGVLLLDQLNMNNPLHEKSAISQLAETMLS